MPTTTRAKARARSTTRKRMSADRRDEILQRLEQLILAEGFATLTIDGIAAQLQCSKSTLYTVASSREQLVIAAIKRFLRVRAQKIEDRVAAADGGAPRRIATYLTSIRDEMADMSRACYDDMRDFEATDELYRMNADASAAKVRELIHEGVADGSFRPVHAEFVSEAVALLIDGIMRGAFLDRIGMSDGDAYGELSALILIALTNESPVNNQ